jgi:hypothetical protein
MTPGERHLVGQVSLVVCSNKSLMNLAAVKDRKVHAMLEARCHLHRHDFLEYVVPSYIAYAQTLVPVLYIDGPQCVMCYIEGLGKMLIMQSLIL